MNNASLYSQCNHLQIRDAEEIIEKFNEFCQPSKNSLKLLDIGSGDGEVLVKVLKMLKVKVKKAIGIDISIKMVEHSRKNYENKLLNFRCINIFEDSPAGNLFTQNNLQSFDIVTSLYCLHWIENLRNAFSKIYDLLKPGGSLVCSVLMTHEIFDAYCHVASNEKYAKYMQSLNKILPGIYHDSDPVGTIATILKEPGFKIKLLKDKKDVFDYETRLNYKNSMKAVNPFVDLMPHHLQDEFMDDLVSYSENQPRKLSEKNSFKIYYRIFYVIASKTLRKYRR